MVWRLRRRIVWRLRRRIVWRLRRRIVWRLPLLLPVGRRIVGRRIVGRRIVGRRTATLIWLVLRGQIGSGGGGECEAWLREASGVVWDHRATIGLSRAPVRRKNETLRIR
jgi:hypothetical protein